MSKVIITTPAYNVSKWIDRYVFSLKSQSYENFEVYFVDDASTDNTVERLTELTKGDPRFHIYKNSKNLRSPLANLIKAFDYANPADGDIIVNIDGDDWLSSPYVLEQIATTYGSTDCWLTYGACQIYPTGQITGHFNIPMPDHISDLNAYKQYPFITSHLRTYRAGLFKKVDREDFVDPRTGEIYTEAGDLALMFPMLEMAGKEHSKRMHSILYILNRENELNEAAVNLHKQKETESVIRSKQRVYARLAKL